jgi:hypothetical protein
MSSQRQLYESNRFKVKGGRFTLNLLLWTLDRIAKRSPRIAEKLAKILADWSFKHNRHVWFAILNESYKQPVQVKKKK